MSLKFCNNCCKKTSHSFFELILARFNIYFGAKHSVMLNSSLSHSLKIIYTRLKRDNSLKSQRFMKHVLGKKALEMSRETWLLYKYATNLRKKQNRKLLKERKIFILTSSIRIFFEVTVKLEICFLGKNFPKQILLIIFVSGIHFNLLPG